MRRWMIGIGMLALAAIGCNLGAEPTLSPAIAFPTATIFIVSSPSPANLVIMTPTVSFATQQPPVVNPVCSQPAGWLRYVVVPGDTLGAIAARARTTVDLLISGNCLTDGNLISVGQTIYVPNALSPVASATPVVNSQTMLMSVQPASIISGQYRVLPGPITIVADNVRAGTRVAYYYQYAGGQQIFLGSSPIFGIRSQFGWDVSTLPLNTTLFLTAVALDAANRYVQYSNQIALIRADSPILLTATPQPAATRTPTSGPAAVGAISATPSELVNGRYRLRAGGVVLNAINVHNVDYVSWVLVTMQAGGAAQSVAVDTGPSGGVASARWTISGMQPFEGTLTAYGFYNGGRSYVQGGTINVYYDPTQP